MSHRRFSSILLAIVTIPIAVALLIPLIWMILYFGIYLGYGNYKVRGHQQFAANGVSQIEPAMQMNQIFADCRNYITYGPNDVPLFNSVAYFGGRYELAMQVPVRIDSASTGAMIGKPEFYLYEVGEVTISPSGQVGASFSRSLVFGSDEWRRVYNAGGDFSVIGFDLNPIPVTDFQRYADAGRPSN